MSKNLNVTITVNRACNLRCKWCYARDTKFSKEHDMKDDVFNNIVSFLKEAPVKKVTFIGGEPTIHPDIIKYIQTISLLGIKITLVTNGLIFKDYSKCLEFKEAGVNVISLSIKASNKENYKNLTDSDKFDDVLLSIQNLKQAGFDLAVSFVITEDNENDIQEMISKVKKAGCDNFFFSFYRMPEKSKNPEELLDKRYKHLKRIEILYEEIMKEKPHIKWVFLDPICLFSKEFVDKHYDDFGSPCYVHGRNNIIFDPKGTLIPCNTLHMIQCGIIGKDFNNYNEYLTYVNTNALYKKIDNKLKGLPSKECISCKYRELCLGRCVCNWISYSFYDLSNFLKRIK